MGSWHSRSSSPATADLASPGRSSSPERPSQREDDEPDTREYERYRDDDSEERGALREERRVERSCERSLRHPDVAGPIRDRVAFGILGRRCLIVCSLRLLGSEADWNRPICA